MNHTTTPLWADAVAPRRWPRLEAPLDVDVLVLGAGITGLTAALRLAEQGMKVAVLEARHIGSGVTSGTSAHVTAVLDIRYAEIEAKFGAGAAHEIAQAATGAIGHIGRRVREYNIDCDFERLDGWLYTEKSDRVVDLESEAQAARRAGLPVTLEPVPLPFPTAAGVRFPNQARFHPLKYVYGLAEACAARGVQIFEETRVRSVEGQSPLKVKCENGVTFEAPHVFCAIHTPLNGVLLNTRLEGHRSYVIAVKADRLPDGLFWDDAEPYHYLRQATVNGQRYALIGGEDHRTGEDEELHHFAALEDWTKAHLGEGLLPEWQWSSQVMEPLDGLPYMGRLVRGRNLYVCTGLSGNGLAMGTVGAHLVADLVLGVPNPLERVLQPTRLKAMSLVTYVKNNSHFPAHLVGDRLKPAEPLAPDHVAAGEGKVMELDGRRVGVYRDDAGVLHGVRAVCPHMGCVLKFNDAERSWDCGCHGSRFDHHGEVLDGPASRPLKPVALQQGPKRKTGK